MLYNIIKLSSNARHLSRRVARHLELKWNGIVQWVQFHNNIITWEAPGIKAHRGREIIGGVILGGIAQGRILLSYPAIILVMV